MPAALLKGRPTHAWHRSDPTQPWQRVPLQARPLGMGSDAPRWWFCEAVAPANATLLISDDASEANVESTRQADTSASVRVERDAHGCVTLANEHVRIELDPNQPGLIRQIVAHGQKVTTDWPWEVAYVIQGQRYTTAATQSFEIEVLEDGPVRAAIEIRGRHQHVNAGANDQAPAELDFRLTLELVAGQPALVMRYWFFHQLPRQADLPVSEMKLKLGLHESSGLCAFNQLKHGMTSVPRVVATRHPLHAAVGHDGAVHLRMTSDQPLEDDTLYPSYHMPPMDEISPWFAAQLPGQWVAIAMDDIADMQPKAIAMDASGFTLDIWPDWASSPMQLPQGRSRSVTLRMAFVKDDSSAQNTPPTHADVTAMLASTGSHGPELLSPADYAKAGVFDQHLLLPNDHAHERFDSYLAKVACPPTAADMFDLGDTPDPGYQTTYLRTGRRLTYTAPPSARQPVQYLTGVRQAVAPWSDITQFEPIWANNEYDVIWCIGSEIMRGQRRDLLTSLKWFARHAIEVDFVHHSDDPFKHRTTPPHCARHTTAGAYPSHFWTEGVLQYYALSGDRDALAFAQAIADKIVQFFTTPETRARLWHPTRELGWALLALAAVVEFDPKKKYVDMASEIAADLIKAPLTDAFIASAVRYAFGFSSIVLGLDKWHGVTGDEKISKWLIDLAKACGPRMDTTPGVELAMGLCILHAGHKHSNDALLVRYGMRTLERIIDSRVWVDPQPYTKPYALLYRPLARFFGDAARAGELSKLDYRY